MIYGMIDDIRRFFDKDSAVGIVLLLAALLAMVFANRDLRRYYDLFLSTHVAISIGHYQIDKPFLLWINDGLMTVFFFHVGLELKRDLFEGHLSDRQIIMLPAIGAVGGMLIPALIYVSFNFQNEYFIKGWAIPAATDIAFALGVLSLLGKRVPSSLKIFLASLAIFDDIGAILIIALFYTSKISLSALIVVVCCLPILFLFNRLKFESKTLYGIIGLTMWVATLKSGVHATLAGVILAIFIPLKPSNDSAQSPLKSMEQDLHQVVSFLILPAFAFANAGINFENFTSAKLLHNVPLGIAAGLVLGKQIGVFGFCWIAIKSKLAKFPDDMNWSNLYGVAALCGIGFTMSLFIGSLAFEETGFHYDFNDRLGIMVGSFISGCIGFTILKLNLRKTPNSHSP